MHAVVPSPLEATHQRSAQVDKLVLDAFERIQPAVTLAAVGGYGRRELFPCSDVDLLLLTSGAPDSAERDAIAEFLRTLWDSKLRVSQSVHTPAECCEIHDGNLELTISLLDRRFLGGDPARFELLSKQFPKFLNAERAGIVSHLARMTRTRHASHGDTIYHLEPNIKEAPGGLRDLHVMHWLTLLKGFETEPLETARDFLFEVRIRLHEHYKRDNNVLSFEAQDWLSSSPAAWMREHYRNARQIFRSVRRVLDLSEQSGPGLWSNFRDWRSRVSNTEFTVARDQILLRSPASLQTDPKLVIRLMEFMARHQVTIARDTEARLRDAPAVGYTWKELRALLGLPRCVNALRTMTDLGFLQQVIPEWSRIDCLVTRDFYHRYTVDEHTLVTLQALENLAASKEPAQRRFVGLLSEVDALDLLRIALLLHDIGKGGGDGEHASKSVAIGREVLERLGVPEYEQQTVLFLIEHHLDLSSVMTSRDLNDPSTARQIADSTGTMERLRLLTLLTYADISAVNPSAMTPWRLEQLWQTYLAGHQELTRELETDRIHPPGQTSAGTASFLEGLPTRYLKTRTAAQIQADMELARNGNAVDIARSNGTYRMRVVSTDRPFLLAAISGTLAGFGMNILKAEAFANNRGLVLDTFVFSDPHRTLELNPGESERLREMVLRAVLGKLEVEPLLENRRRAAAKARLEPRVRLSNELSETATLVEIVAEDRPGLLYDLAQAISSAGGNIEVVLIDTEAHRALDVFYVTADGRKVDAERMAAMREKLVTACRG